jgi:lactoylglutathione lyase
VRLAKPHLDIGLFTNDAGSQREFWADTVGLRLDHELEMAPGWVQHRFDAHGSVIKVNHRTAPLPDLPPSGYAALSIAAQGGRADWTGAHPGGDRVELVTPGAGGVVGIGITVASPDPARLLEFYRSALRFDQVEPGVLRCGDTVFRVVEGPGGRAVEDFAAPGFRYITVQVFDADLEMEGMVRRGARIVREAVNFAGVARYGFVSDPDGNWIEVSARTSLTGIAVPEAIES